MRPAADMGTWCFITERAIPKTPHHTRHFLTFARYTDGYNLDVLRGVDIVQSHAPDGGGYFTGIRAVPTESPIGYPLALFGQPLLDPPRTTSFCSGSTYTAFIEALNLILGERASELTPERLEAMRMQEPDGSRREDGVKFWGHWNDDGWGCQYALVQFSGMGEVIPPMCARPGDFANISWTNGGGHSVVFLGWYVSGGKLGIAYWSSSNRTDGMADDHFAPVGRIRSMKFVRLTHPERLFTFNPATPVETHVPGDTIVPSAQGAE